MNKKEFYTNWFFVFLIIKIAICYYFYLIYTEPAHVKQSDLLEEIDYLRNQNKELLRTNEYLERKYGRGDYEKNNDGMP